MRSAVCLSAGLLASFLSVSDAGAAEAPAKRADAAGEDLFPGALRPTVAAATGVPFLGAAEAGLGITDNLAIGVVGAVAPSTWTVGLRPRLRLPTSERTALVLVSPLLFYPKGEGPLTLGATTWVLARTELLFDVAVGSRWHVAGGMGIIAAASTDALFDVARGRAPTLPPYGGRAEPTRGFAGGLWNTVAARSSVALDRRSHLFAEASLLLRGVVPAEELSAIPLLFNIGAQRAF